MGKKSKGGAGNLGKSLIRDRFGSSKIKRNNDESLLHTAEINDGYDWGRLNLNSVTEESSFQEFLSTAELAGTEFHAEKLNIKFVDPNSNIGLLARDERNKILELQEKNKNLLKIPRKPKWDNSTTAEELQSREKQAFLDWRRCLAILQETEDLILTPYEKNLELWRQLWRVIERSDVIVQIVDARNPLLFRCEDLEEYVKEVNSDKFNMILINKADFLTDEQREAWAKYFTGINMRIAFFSATLAAEKEKIQEQDEDKTSTTSESENIDYDKGDESSDESLYNSEFASESEYESAEDSFINNDLSYSKAEYDKQIETEYAIEKLKVLETDPEYKIKETEEIINSSKLLNREELVTLFKNLYSGKTYTKGVTTIGLIGYPNVGKSSTINALLMDKKVSVSATPGKTKHFQTLYLEEDLLLCDCPGLVMPSFVSTKAEMILNGILPIDQMRDHVPAVTLLATMIPRHIMEDLYGLMLPVPSEGEDPDRAPTAEQLLNAYGYNRGFMTQNGQPDNPRSARYVLKDFVNGKLLYCVAPPTVEQEYFHTFPLRRRELSNRCIPPRAARINKGIRTTIEDLDRVFFQDKLSGVHVKRIFDKGPQYSSSIDTESTTGSMKNLLLHEKPWKKINKHVNKKKHEKTRRLYAHLDQH